MRYTFVLMILATAALPILAAPADGQTQSYLLSPPYAPNGDGLGVGVLPDPITNGPFVGSRDLLGSQ